MRRGHFAARVASRCAALQFLDALAVFGLEPLRNIPWHLALAGQSLDQLQGGAVSLESGVAFLLVIKTIVRDAELSNQQRQRQPLQYEGGEDDAKGKIKNVATRRKRHAAIERERQRERGSERDNTAHARPGDKRDFLPPWEWIAFAQPAREQSRQPRCRKDPGNAHKDDRGTNGGADSDQMRPRFARELAKNFRQLQADRHEDEAIDKKDNHFPKRLCLQAITRLRDQRQVPPEINSRGHRGEDTGNM